MLDTRFPTTNLFTVSLHSSRPLVLDLLLDRDMIDISTSCRRPLASNLNNAMTLGPKTFKDYHPWQDDPSPVSLNQMDRVASVYFNGSP